MFASRPTGPPQLRISGIPVRIEPMFWLVTVGFGLLNFGFTARGVGWVVIVGVSLLLHELGHAAAFLAFGSRPAIMLHGFGGLTYARAPQRRWQSIVVSLAGATFPLVVIGLPALYLAETRWALLDPLRYDLVQMVIWVNVYWGLVNLLPLLPLDGGHVVEQFTGPRVARIVTIAVAVPVALLAFQWGFVFGGILAGILALQAYTQLRTPSILRANVSITKPSTRPAPAPERSAVEAAALEAAARQPDEPWSRGAVDLAGGRPIVALRTFEEAALAGPPPPAAVALLGDEGLAPRLAERLLARSGARAAGAVAELVGGLLHTERPGPAALVAERLAADGRSPELARWAAAAAADAWARVGETERAARWARIAAERS